MTLTKFIKIIGRLIFYPLFTLFLLYIGIFNGYTFRYIFFPHIFSQPGYKVTAESIVISPFTLECYASNLRIKSADNKFEVYAENLFFYFDVIKYFQNNFAFDYIILKNSRIKLSFNDKEFKEWLTDFVTYKNKYRDEKVFPFEIEKITFDNVSFDLSKSSPESKRAARLQLKNIHLEGNNISTNKSGEIYLDAESNIYIKGKVTREIDNKFSMIYKQHLNELNVIDFLACKIKILHTDKIESTLEGYFYLLPKKSNTTETPFVLASNLNQIELLPLYRFFIDSSYSDSNGILERGRILLVGQDLHNLNSTNIRYISLINMSDVTIPVYKENVVFTMIFLPVEILANVNSLLGSSITSLFDSNVSADPSSMLTNIGSSVFSKLASEMSYSDEVFTVYMFYMKGKPPCTIDDFHMKGTANLHGKINLQSTVNVSGILMPLDITGTIKSPYARKALAVVRTAPYNIRSLFESVFQDQDKIKTEKRDELKYFYDSFYPITDKQAKDVELNINTISIDSMPTLLKNIDKISEEAYGFDILKDE